MYDSQKKAQQGFFDSLKMSLMSRTEAQSVDDCDGKAPVLSLSALLCVLRLTVTMFSTAGVNFSPCPL